MATPGPACRRLVLFPGALGDLLCCWPALDGLRARGETVTLAARPDLFAALPADVGGWSIDRREIAELFADGPTSPQLGALLTGHDAVDSFTGAENERFAARLAAAAGCRTRVHGFRAMRPGESARAYYARCLAVAPLLQALPVRPAAADWAAARWRSAGLGGRVLVVHPGSGSPAKNWSGVDQIAERWRLGGGQVVALLGPAEIERGVRPRTADLVISGEPLDRIAAVIARGDRYLGNDSGVSHLAGLLGSNALVLFGDSDPLVWAPAGAGVRILRAGPPCRRCGPGQLCTHRLAVDAVLAALG